MVGRPKEFERDDVVAAAIEVFWTNGYEATSLDDLTGAMKIGRGSLYNEFGDKHSLFVEALDQYGLERMAQLRAALAAASSARAGIEAVFRRSVRVLWDDPCRRGCLLVNSAAELAASDPDVATRAKRAFEGFASEFRTALERGQRDGELHEGLDVRATSRFLAGAFIELRALAKITSRGAADDIVEVTLKALD